MWDKQFLQTQPPYRSNASARTGSYAVVSIHQQSSAGAMHSNGRLHLAHRFSIATIGMRAVNVASPRVGSWFGLGLQLGRMGVTRLQVNAAVTVKKSAITPTT